jgi:hypothetical protein
MIKYEKDRKGQKGMYSKERQGRQDGITVS